MTAQVEGEIVIFLIGMRINRAWKIHKWIPVARAMPRMLRELEADSSSGFLGFHMWIGNPTISLQYWRSFEHLERYAKNASRLHRPAWAAFNRAIANNGDVGIWHETYIIKPGNYETVYSGMPPYGLGKVGKLVPATGARDAARSRMSSGVPSR